MINLTFPNGSHKQFPKGITGLAVAQQISSSLAKEAFVVEINSELKDLSYEIHTDATIKIFTVKDSECLEVIRHDAAHILAEAAKEIFPNIQVTIGPAIENGFYYDFAKDEPFSSDDLVKLELKMYEIVQRNEQITREEWNREEAIDFFKSIGEYYKAEIISAIPQGQQISLYRQGKFIDLCRGPHAPSTGRIKYFKLTKVAGAYWRGDSNNPMLQRIYGTAWATKDQLQQYLNMLEEAEKRDHRKLGRELELFHFQEEAQGMVFWHDKGYTIYRIIESYIRNKLEQSDYSEVKTPILFDKSLWQDSGHWDKFKEDMFTLDAGNKTLGLKPMNCPGHVQIFKQGTKSYRDLPLRMAEFGCCHRNEASGALHGLFRVRSFVQDDAHIFCTEDQIVEETINYFKLLTTVYKDFGFEDIRIKFSDRPKVRAGSDETWDKAENALKEATIKAGFEYSINSGEGAFYGPKLEIILKDAIGREWQCGTWQVDFVLPERLDANYISSKGDKKRPVMLHRALIGTFERFIGILVEQYAGCFPLWLAPVQIALVTITNDCDQYTAELHKTLNAAGIRSELDISSEKVNYKIRNYSNKKIPIIGVVGKKEMSNNTISLRKLGSDSNKEIADLPEEMTIEELVLYITQKNAKYLT
ncbi:MAG: threonine--tRNA ligase [Rickettsiaceae bacterium]|nr:MAG: threonine--tRNA ligase [Rickettsiaceae bacterium]